MGPSEGLALPLQVKLQAGAAELQALMLQLRMAAPSPLLLLQCLLLLGPMVRPLPHAAMQLRPDALLWHQACQGLVRVSGVAEAA